MQKTRLHKVLVNAVTHLVADIVPGKQYADKAIERALGSNPKWGSKDRSFIVETTNALVRNYRLAAFISGQDWEDKKLNNWHLFGAWWLHHGLELPEWPEFEGLDSAKVAARAAEARGQRAVWYSLPDWLDALGLAEMGEEHWQREVAAMHQTPQTVLRVNTLKTSKPKLAERLLKQGIETETLPWAPDALVLTKRKHLLNLPEFQDGWFEIQDAASQMIVPMLRVQPGQQVIDACAGAGGKTLQITSLMQNKGKVLAMEPEAIKLKNTKLRAKRAGYSNIETVQITDPAIINQYRNHADRLLLDVPCSGLGVLKRNPDAKWKLTPQHIGEVRQLQQDLISRYCQMVKPGGLMVYATCSILPSEDSQQVNTFLASHPNFTLEKEQYFLPSEYGFDGFYAAVLVRKA